MPAGCGEVATVSGQGQRPAEGEQRQRGVRTVPGSGARRIHRPIERAHRLVRYCQGQVRLAESRIHFEAIPQVPECANEKLVPLLSPTCNS